MNKKLAIFGSGGHGKVVGEIALLNQFSTIDFFDDKFKEIKEFPFPLIGNLECLKNLLDSYDFFFVAIGNNISRFKITKYLAKENIKLISLFHPSSVISKFCSIGKGVCLMANSVVNAGSIINDGAVINSSASIDHDCFVGNFAHISPNCSLSGNVSVGDFSHLGTGTSVHPAIRIGNKVITGVGSDIFKDILDNEIYKNS